MASFWERQARKAKNIATNPLTYAGPAGWMAQAVDSATGGKVTDAGRDLVRDVPLLGSALNQESTAERIAREQSQAVSEAQQFQEQQYQQARGFLKPYYQMGSAAYRDMASGIRSGKYVQDPFGAPEGSEITNFTYNID
ncbi:MAG: hypothetical protein R3243_15970, partial [Arenibacter latericius]|nr:hypothetical protein [Arenibacter latericius]